MEWEKHNGKVPVGHLITFKDGNHRNCNIENLMCITRSVHGILNHECLRSASPELTETAATLAKLKHRIREIKTETKGELKC